MSVPGLDRQIPMDVVHTGVEESPLSLVTRADLFSGYSMRLQAVRAGPQTDTVHFATWEEHTRGVGSRLMAAMGYRKGAGLGARIKGSAAPIEVHI